MKAFLQAINPLAQSAMNQMRKLGMGRGKMIQSGIGAIVNDPAAYFSGRKVTGYRGLLQAPGASPISMASNPTSLMRPLLGSANSTNITPRALTAAGTAIGGVAAMAMLPDRGGYNTMKWGGGVAGYGLSGYMLNKGLSGNPGKMRYMGKAMWGIGALRMTGIL